MFIYNLEGIAQKLKIDFDGVTSKIEHNGVKGSAREDLLKKYLIDLLPLKYTISSGIIIDSDQHQSKQQDFIIYDSFNSPKFYCTSSDSILPIESVYATIEIKSVLDKETLIQSAQNIASVRCLQNDLESGGVVLPKEFIYPLGFVFSYSSNTSLETLQKNLAEINKTIPYNQQISIVCVLDKGLIFNVLKENVSMYTAFPTKDTLISRSENNLKDNLYSFYLLLMQYLNSAIIYTPDLMKYATKMDAFHMSSNIPKEILTEDATMVYGDYKVGYGDAMTGVNLMRKNERITKGLATIEELGQYLIGDFLILMDLTMKMNNIGPISIDFFGYHFKQGELEELKQMKLDIENNKETNEKYNEKVSNMYNYYKKYFSSKL